MTVLLVRLLIGFDLIVLGYFLLAGICQLLAAVIASAVLRRHRHRSGSVEGGELLSGDAPPVTIIMPVHECAAQCDVVIRSLLSLKYPVLHVIVVNDGSADDTLDRLTAAFALEPSARLPSAHLPTAPVRAIYASDRHPNLWVLDKEHGGRADALNCGLNFCRTPLFCVTDADTLLARDVLLRAVRPFIEDHHTIAAGGPVGVLNGCATRHGVVTEVQLPPRLLVRIQVLLQLRTLLCWNLVWAALRSLLVIARPFGLFRRSTVVDLGGYDATVEREDVELVVRLQRMLRQRRQAFRIVFVPGAVAWTRCPETLRAVARQRRDWQRGLVQAAFAHTRLPIHPRHGTTGMLAVPHLLLFDVLGPLLEVAGWAAFALTLAMGRAGAIYVVAFLSLAVVLRAVAAMAIVVLQELTELRYPRLSDLLRLLAATILENIGFHQLDAWWRTTGTLTARIRDGRRAPGPRSGLERVAP